MKTFKSIILLVFLLAVAGCPTSEEATTADGKTDSTPDPATPVMTGEVKVDGSSTVGPISMAVAESFMEEAEYAGIRVTVGISGTGGGFKKFVVGETDINDASRPVKQKELDAMGELGIDVIELPVAFDGLAVMVNPENDWVDHLTVAELKAICEPESGVDNWNQIRDGFPDVPLKLYVPGTDSGTFEYFTEAICEEAGAHRSDCAAMSEDDNVLVTGISGDKGALGYFGFAYYAENQDKLKLVPIKYGDAEPVAPSDITINNGTYQPLSRPIFIYVSTAAMDREEVGVFVNYYLDNAPWLVGEVGYVALPDDIYDLGKKHFAEKVTGSMFGGGGATVGVSLTELMGKLSN